MIYLAKFRLLARIDPIYFKSVMRTVFLVMFWTLGDTFPREVIFDHLIKCVSAVSSAVNS